MVEDIICYKCGYCINNEALVLKGAQSQKKVFWANAFLIRHSDYGYVLFDTGYSSDMIKCKLGDSIVQKVYLKINPTYVTPTMEIGKQLKADSINIDEIKYIVLSHLHPDHIGGLKYFKEAEKIIISRETYNEYKRNSVKNLIFKSLIPDWFESKLFIVDIANRSEKSRFVKTWLVEPRQSYIDMFNDGSMRIISIPGHTCGQIGLILNNKVVIAADAAWGRNYMYRRLTPIGRLIQWNMHEYIKTLTFIQRLHTSGKTIYFSHDDYPKYISS